RAGRDLWGLVVELPDEPRAADAVEYLVARVRGDQPAALWQRLTALATALPDSAVTDNLLWWLADLAEHELHDPAAALVLYDRLPVDHPRSGLRDDARWRAANLARARGDARGAVDRLRALLATREVAFGPGSYFSIWLDDAQLLLGTILRDDLGDHRAAAAAFAQLPRDYPASILVDDALAALADLALADGDVAAACRAAARLLAHDPDSRFAPHARELVRRPDCPDGGHEAAP
ncbi:MAG TPA: tetratricopeptide repeat protein, partial [Kofleriaceae bacterium]|nr:tetratricopeptide repeat protein [Kofleriaceae bacterium]